MKCSQPYQQRKPTGFTAEYPCGRCLACRINRADEWATRLLLELEDTNQIGDFVTLTFDDAKCCPLLPQALSKRLLQTFFKRVRKAGNKIKYFACGEYGEKLGRAHYHIIVIRKKEVQPNYQKHWPWGNVPEPGNVTKASCRYVTGYLTKSNTIPPGKERWPPFQLQSQGMGLEWAKANRHNVNKELKWTPKYFGKKLRLVDRPLNSKGATHPPTLYGTSMEQLIQRARNLEGQRASKN